jgi:hypothetical protein
MKTERHHETNSTVDRRARWDRNARQNRDCPLCPPHRGENTTPRPRHGTKKPRYKDR